MKNIHLKRKHPFTVRKKIKDSLFSNTFLQSHGPRYPSIHPPSSIDRPFFYYHCVQPNHRTQGVGNRKINKKKKVAPTLDYISSFTKGLVKKELIENMQVRKS